MPGVDAGLQFVAQVEQFAVARSEVAHQRAEPFQKAPGTPVARQRFPVDEIVEDSCHPQAADLDALHLPFLMLSRPRRRPTSDDPSQLYPVRLVGPARRKVPTFASGVAASELSDLFFGRDPLTTPGRIPYVTATEAARDRRDMS